MRHAPYSTFTDATPVAAHPAARPASRVGVVLAKLLWVAALPRRVAAIRRDMALLGGMSASELADIGLTRQDVCDVGALPLGTPPGPLLTRRVAERRASARHR